MDLVQNIRYFLIFEELSKHVMHEQAFELQMSDYDLL